MKVSLRPARPEDARACGQICYDAFKGIAEDHNFPPDFPSADVTTGLLSDCFSRDDLYTVVAESAGQIVGSNVLWEHGDVAAVGPITVDPTAQRSSAGRQLMADILERASSRGFERVRLVQATFNNLSMALYAKLGFDVREPLSVMQGAPLRISIPGYEVRSVTAEDLDACDRLCLQVHGHRRQGELADAIQQGTALLVEREGSITGYATGIAFFSHAVAQTNQDLKALIGAVDEYAGPGFLLPTRNAEMLRWCLENGLRIIQPMTLMSRGPYQEPRGSFLTSVLF